MSQSEQIGKCLDEVFRLIKIETLSFRLLLDLASALQIKSKWLKTANDLILEIKNIFIDRLQSQQLNKQDYKKFKKQLKKQQDKKRELKLLKSEEQPNQFCRSQQQPNKSNLIQFKEILMPNLQSQNNQINLSLELQNKYQDQLTKYFLKSTIKIIAKSIVLKQKDFFLHMIKIFIQIFGYVFFEGVTDHPAISNLVKQFNTQVLKLHGSGEHRFKHLKCIPTQSEKLCKCGQSITKEGLPDLIPFPNPQLGEIVEPLIPSPFWYCQTCEKGFHYKCFQSKQMICRYCSVKSQISGQIKNQCLWIFISENCQVNITEYLFELKSSQVKRLNSKRSKLQIGCVNIQNSEISWPKNSQLKINSLILYQETLCIEAQPQKNINYKSISTTNRLQYKTFCNRKEDKKPLLNQTYLLGIFVTLQPEPLLIQKKQPQQLIILTDNTNLNEVSFCKQIMNKKENKMQNSLNSISLIDSSSLLDDVVLLDQ